MVRNIIKKFLLISIIVVIAGFSFLISAQEDDGRYHHTASVQYKPGDINYDGKINSTDYILLKRYILNIDIPYLNGDELLVADLNGNGKVNSIDLVLLRRYILGIIDVFPVETVDEFLVSKVSADNLKEVVVEFNKYLDENTVTSDNIKVVGHEATVKLEDDKKTVLITLIDNYVFSNMEEHQLIVERVKCSKGLEIQKVEKTFTALDFTLPYVLEVKAISSSKLQIVFSEPISNKSNPIIEVKSEDTEIDLSFQSTVFGTRTVEVDLWTDMVDENNYIVRIEGFIDYSNYTMIPGTFSIHYQDFYPPKARIMKVDQKYIMIKFSKPVTGLHKSQFYHTFQQWTAMDIYKTSNMTVPGGDVSTSDLIDTAWVKFAEDVDTGIPLHTGKQIIGIAGKTTESEIKDKRGNLFEDTTTVVTVLADKSAPKVSKVKVKNEKTLRIIFSEDVSFNVDNIEILDENNKQIDGVLLTVAGGPKEYEVDLGKDLLEKKIVVNIKNVEDTAIKPNRMSFYSTTIKITTLPEPVSKITKKESDKSIFIFFNETVNNSALENSNYGLVSQGTNVRKELVNTPQFFFSDKVIRIILTDDEFVRFISGSDFFVRNIIDVDGNVMADQIILNNEIFEYDHPDYQPKVEEVRAIAENMLVVKFDQPILFLNTNHFIIKNKGIRGRLKSMEVSRNDEGCTVVTLITHEDNKFNPDLSGLTLAIDPILGREMKNVFGVLAKSYIGDEILTTTSVPPILDDISPQIAKDDNGDYNISANAGTNIIEIVFDEPIDVSSLSIPTFIVNDRKVESILVDKNHFTNYKVIISLQGENFIKGEKLEVSQSVPVCDLSGNEYRLADTVTVTVD
ncbi:UNVERIFIED_CONTAM: dockerin type I repeat protein [Acetivibrio alkalicellulosi]